MTRITPFLAAGITMASAGDASAYEKKAPFSCKLPWLRGDTACHEKMFSLRARETVTITVESIVDKKGNAITDECPDFQVIDKNDDDTVIKTLNICAGKSKTFTHSRSDESDLIIKLNASMGGFGRATVEGSYTITQGK